MCYFDFRLVEFVRPDTGRAIHPRGAEPGRARAVDVVQRMIANVQRLLCIGATDPDSQIKYLPGRLRRASHRRGHYVAEQMFYADRFEIGIAVRYSDQDKPLTQCLERWHNLGKYLDVIAYSIKNSKCVVDEVRAISCRSTDSTQHRAAQERQIVRLIGKLGYYLRANFTQVSRLIQLCDAGIVFPKPPVQALFRTPDHRVNFPERIVEIDRYCSNVIHGCCHCAYRRPLWI